MITMVRRDESESSPNAAGQRMHNLAFVWHTFAATVWALASGLQSTYVISPNKLEVCVENPNFTPCKGVAASWVMALILL